MAFKKWHGKEDLAPAQVTDEVLRQWKRHLRDEVFIEKSGRKYKRKPTTINARLTTMRSFLHWAREPVSSPKSHKHPGESRLDGTWSSPWTGTSRTDCSG